MRLILTDPSFGDRLRHYRVLKGYKQTGLTAHMHLYGSTMSSYTYSKIELGNRNISLPDFLILKIILDFSYDEFFSDMESQIKRLCDSEQE